MRSIVKLLRVGPPGGERPAVLDHDGQLRDASGLIADVDATTLGAGGTVALAEAVASGSLPTLPADIRIGAPVQPGKIVCIGLNYRDHAAETGAPCPDEPVVFLKAADTVVGAYDDVRIPRRSTKTDWEIELGVVIGTTARYLESEDEAAGCIAGYTISHDVTEREFQHERGGQWDKGKSCETFNPLGPWLVTADEVPDPQALGLELLVNGVRRQHSTTAAMIFPVLTLVRYLSWFMVLRPGDLINTGTPAGVAFGQVEPKPYLRPGDIVELAVDGLGRQRQHLVAS
jgi:2-keto-4-pentenoate hydratase/2-oxohepta-3-ene-1,7-dioic acid hydratase in catechol pathway